MQLFRQKIESYNVVRYPFLVCVRYFVMSLFKFLAFVLMFVSVSMVAISQTPALPADNTGYLIGPGDVITIKTLGEPTFDVDSLTVGEDGSIQIPYYEKSISAKCKTERSLQAEVAKAWSKYLRNPQDNLRVKERNSRPPVNIYGEVRTQLQVPLTRRAHLLELISHAGGPTEKSGGMVQVFRTQPPMCAEPGNPNDWKVGSDNPLGVPSRVFSLTAIRQGQDDSNPEIFPGDIIVVEKSAPVYVTGEVIKPGEVSIPEGGLPLTQAIAMASGITREAKTKNIKIYRRKAGSPQPELIAANYDQIKKGAEKDVMLQAFDIVEVDKASKKFTDYLLDFVTGVPNRIPIRPF